jgi:hypothetical protein
MPQTKNKKREDAFARNEAYRELSIEARIKLVKERIKTTGGKSEKELNRLQATLEKEKNPKKKKVKKKQKV